MPKHAEELFPLEDEVSAVEDSIPCSQPEKPKKRGKPSPHYRDNKKSKTGKSSSPPPATASTSKPTMRDLFGDDADSDDDESMRLVNSTVPIDLSESDNEILNTDNKSTKFKCDKCNTELDESMLKYHVRTNIHKSNCLMKSELENVDIIGTAFKNRIRSYRVNPPQGVQYHTPEEFLHDHESKIVKLINLSLQKHTCIKINFELFASFVLPKTDELSRQLKSFNIKYNVIYNSTDLSQFYSEVIQQFCKKMMEFEHCESGWSFESISHLEININKYSPLKGGSYIDLPNCIKNTKSCINIKNDDDYCFLWSIVAALYPCKKNANRINSYPHYSSILDIRGMHFPPTPNDIKLFEANNFDISVNIYGLDNKNLVTGPLYTSNARKQNHINLLYFEKGDKQHYCLIKDLVRLVKRRQLTLHKGKIYLCEECLQFFASQKKYDSHNCSKVLTVLPHNKTLQFEHYERQQKINFVIYTDFESLLINHTDTSNKNTQKYKIHKPSCFAYYICCSHDPSLNKYRTYRGPDCVEYFINYLIQDVQKIYEVLDDKKPMAPLTVDEENECRNAKFCHICKRVLLNDRVIDHDSITSKFRGVAHAQCNIRYRLCSFVPVVIHNLSGYDSHLFIKELSKYPGDIKIIPKTKEKYMSITKYIPKNNTNERSAMQIKFIDSFQFLSASLDNLSKNLTANEFIHSSKVFVNKKQFDLIKEKGIYPYDYMDSWSRYNEKTLPPKNCFYNSLKQEHISDDEYHKALTIWKEFDIQSLGEYTDLYLKTDVFLLCDIFENFRNTSLNYYKLDPAYYVSSPGLSWDAMLFHTGVQLELIQDLEIYELFEKGIRGGLAQCSLRHAVANNKYLPNYDESKNSEFLVYLDCNNLYGFAMMKKTPISEFRFLTQNEINMFNLSNCTEDDEYGYILEVDLAYPDHLHDSHSDLPFAPEKFIPPGGKTPKLIANLYDKYNYIIHYMHLKECIKQGLQLKKVHRIICFRQHDFLKKYIELNTELRQNATSAFQKDFFKLLNNAIFGKTIQNKRKQLDVKLVTCWRDNFSKTNKHLGAEKLIAKPNLKNVAIFANDFVAIQLKPEKIVLDRPIYIGFTVLEYAKTHLYKFHYNFIRNKYGANAKLCYTDTDSLLYLIKTNDIYEDMRKTIDNFDTSNYSSKNVFGMPRINAKVPGLFKDELGGDVICEFIGLRAKLYCIRSLNIQINKAKGASKSVTKRLALSNYRDTLCKNKEFKFKMNMIKSIHHALYSQEVTKLVLNGNDDKRQIINGVQTVPWGHSNNII